MAGLWRDGFLLEKMTDTLTSTIPEVCPELGIEVPVSAIEPELRKLWEQDEAQTNASLINLVVYSEKPGALIENSQIIRELTREHACRAILVGIDRNEPKPSLRAWLLTSWVSDMYYLVGGLFWRVLLAKIISKKSFPPPS